MQKVKDGLFCDLRHLDNSSLQLVQVDIPPFCVPVRNRGEKINFSLQFRTIGSQLEKERRKNEEGVDPPQTQFK